MAVERKITLDKRINRFKLEEECGNLPNIYQYWGRKAAEAKEERDNAKSKLENVKARVQIQIRTGKYSIPVDSATDKPMKLSEKSIEALVDMDGDVSVAKEDYAREEKLYNKAKANEETIQIKRSSLNNLKDLYTKEYYTLSADGSMTTQSRADIGSDDQRKNLKKRQSKED